jgi:hypothetical protein
MAASQRIRVICKTSKAAEHGSDKFAHDMQCAQTSNQADIFMRKLSPKTRPTVGISKENEGCGRFDRVACHTSVLQPPHENHVATLGLRCAFSNDFPSELKCTA